MVCRQQHFTACHKPVLNGEIDRILVLRLKTCYHILHVPPNLLYHPPVRAAVLKLRNWDNQLSCLHAEVVETPSEVHGFHRSGCEGLLKVGHCQSTCCTHHPSKDPPQEVLIGEVFNCSLEGVVGNSFQEDLVPLILVFQMIRKGCDCILCTPKVVPSLLPEDPGGIVVGGVLDVLGIIVHHRLNRGFRDWVRRVRVRKESFEASLDMLRLVPGIAHLIQPIGEGSDNPKHPHRTSEYLDVLGIRDGFEVTLGVHILHLKKLVSHCAMLDAPAMAGAHHDASHGHVLHDCV